MRPLLVAMVLVLLAGGVASAELDRGLPACPPVTPSAHCLVVEPRPHARFQTLARALARDGVVLQRENDLWTVTLDDAAIQRVFGLRIAYRRVEAGATARTLCLAYTEGHIVRRYARWIRRVVVGHQICE